MAHRHCNDFSRAQLLRRAAAEAGRGLPACEHGAPLPAGTGLSRRSLLLRSAAMTLSIYGASRLGVDALEAGVAEAAAGPDNPVLVSVFLDGGADSLSLLAPTGDPLYSQLRPKLALPEGAGHAFSEDDRLRWHPAASAFRELHEEGKLTAFPAIGYDDPDQSHFTSRHYWEVGALQANERTGWMGRYLDQVGSDGNPLQGLSLQGRLAPALASSRVPVAAIDGPNYELWSWDLWGQVQEEMWSTLPRIGAAHANGSQPMREVGAVAVQAGRLQEQLRPFSGDDGQSITSPVNYPDGRGEPLPENLAALAAMLGAGLPLRCVAVDAAGEYDTHDNQPDDFERGLRLTTESLLAFQRDLEARGLADRVLVHVWSEFGRRPAENGSDGTDHGAGGASFLIGNRVRGQMVGEFPGLDRLDGDGNLRATSDFRALYCSLLEQWFSTDAAAVIPNAGSFARPSLIA